MEQQSTQRSPNNILQVFGRELERIEHNWNLLANQSDNSLIMPPTYFAWENMANINSLSIHVRKKQLLNNYLIWSKCLQFSPCVSIIQWYEDGMWVAINLFTSSGIVQTILQQTEIHHQTLALYTFHILHLTTFFFIFIPAYSGTWNTIFKYCHDTSKTV